MKLGQSTAALTARQATYTLVASSCDNAASTQKHSMFQHICLGNKQNITPHNLMPESMATNPCTPDYLVPDCDNPQHPPDCDKPQHCSTHTSQSSISPQHQPLVPQHQAGCHRRACQQQTQLLAPLLMYCLHSQTANLQLHYSGRAARQASAHD